MSHSQRICGMLLHAYYMRDPRVQRAAHALRNAGWLVKVICLNEGDEKQRETVDGVEIIRSNLSRSTTRTPASFVIEYASFLLRSLYLLLREEFRARHDVVVVHNMPNALVFATLPLRLWRCPVILDMHDSAPETLKSQFGVRSRKLLKVVEVEESLAMRYSSGLITVNRGIERVLKDRHPWARFELIHNSPSNERIRKTVAPSLSTEDQLQVVFHGHLHERNGVQRFIAVLPSLVVRNISIQFHVYGEGPFRDALVELAEKAGVSDIVIFHGAFRPRELPAILAGKHVGVNLHFPSDFGDLLLPVKMLEYAHAGIPVVAPRLATVCEYFSEQCVNYFDTESELEDVIVGIFSDYDGALRKAASARAVSESISWDKEASRFVSYVESKCNKQ